MWLDRAKGLSQEEFPIFELLPEKKNTRQYYKQHAKQSTDLRVTLTESLDLQNEQTERSKRLMILMQETSLYDSLIAF